MDQICRASQVTKHALAAASLRFLKQSGSKRPHSQSGLRPHKILLPFRPGEEIGSTVQQF
jgi:hypothetical protein